MTADLIGHLERDLDRHKVRLEEVRDENERLRAALADLYEEAGDMRAYVPDYFAKKWKHDEALERAKAALGVTEAAA